jgi:four helix bundle protein
MVGRSFQRGEKERPTMSYQLPHHKLQAYGVAIQLLQAVRETRIRDCHLRDQAMRAAKSACLNAAEGAGRVTRADKARCFTIARAEACEACAAVEIAVTAGDANAEALETVLALGDRFVAMTTALIR